MDVTLTLTANQIEAVIKALYIAARASSYTGNHDDGTEFDWARRAVVAQRDQSNLKSTTVGIT